MGGGRFVIRQREKNARMPTSFSLSVLELYPAQPVAQQVLPEDPPQPRGSDGEGRLLGDRPGLHQGTQSHQGGRTTALHQAETTTKHQGTVTRIGKFLFKNILFIFLVNCNRGKKKKITNLQFKYC